MQREANVYIGKNRDSIICLLISITYLTISLVSFQSSNQFVIKNKDGGYECCAMDSNRIVKNLLIYILAPSLFIRCMAHLKYKQLDPADVKDADSYVYIFYNGSYGLWTIFNLMRYF